MEMITQAEYARRVGVSKVAIHKQVRAGVIPLHDGKIDPVEADAARSKHCDPTKTRGHASTGEKPSQPKKKKPSRAPKKNPPTRPAPEPPPAPRHEPPEVSNPGTDDLESGIMPADVSRSEELARGEWLKNLKRWRENEEASGRLIDREKTRREVFSMGRQFREHWINWPARVASTLAAETGADPKKMQGELDRLVREHLSEMSDAKLKAKKCKT